MISSIQGASMSPHYFDVLVPSLRSASYRELAMPGESLPFTVRLVQNQTDLEKAVHIRHAAYGRHVPQLARTLRRPEAGDAEPGSVVLLAESKIDGEALGTMRIQTNRYQPLALEKSLDLPGWLAARPLAEATRLGVTGQRVGRMVKTVLFKAFFQYCRQAGIEWMVIAGRAPIDRQYDALLFSDVYPGMGAIPLSHAGNMPHRVLSFEVGTAEERWAQAQHPLYNFIFATHHPDIDLRSRDRLPVAAAEIRRFHVSGDKLAA
jgi:hypothetical protein